MEIKNRVVEHPNRVMLEVLNVERNLKGEIVSIQANLIKDEGEVYQEGLALNERNLNLLCKKYYLGVDEDSWNGLGQSSSFIIETLEDTTVRLVGGNYNDFELNTTINYLENNQVQIIVSQGATFTNLSLTLARVYELNFELIDNNNLLIDTITLKISFALNSQN